MRNSADVIPWVFRLEDWVKCYILNHSDSASCSVFTVYLHKRN